MTPEQTHTWLQIQQRQMLALEKMAVLLEKLTAAVERLTPRTAPNYQFPLKSFKDFDWSSIGATVERKDQYGPAIVSWGGQQYTRRSPTNKYDPAVWFSRCVGKGDDGNNLYERLITFKPLSKTEVDPLPDKVSRLIDRI
ncbi:hypothetical protein AMR41_10820 [Hapalosiphon sp. MRB220]|nr:hypothetical protein AMR41_10820 [Hapalosiphon sp. MRB220]